jgi:UDPglucose 6-dehydrogenase
VRISVIGAGYVGLVSSACFAEIGHDCACVDLDANRVARINAGETPLHERGLDDLMRRHAGRRLRATTDLRAAVLESEATFIAVGTPFNGQHIDLGQIRAAALAIGAALSEKRDYHAVIVKSTVVPGTTDDVVLPLLEQSSGRRAGKHFGVGMNPEFLTEGVAVADFMEPDRIVLGGMDERTIETQRRIYGPFSGTPFLATNNRTAEMIKYSSNLVLATLISFSNEIGNLCSKIGGVDAVDVMRGVHMARYFATRANAPLPSTASITSFLWPGCGYGGSCLPKDSKALLAHAAEHGARMPLLAAVIETNAEQPSHMVAMLASQFETIAGLKVAVLGLSFKEDTDDVRESPAIPIVRMLLERGAHVIAYDPAAVSTARALLPQSVGYARSMEEAVSGADAVMLITRWEEFRRLPEVLANHVAPPLVLDGRRLLDPAALRRYGGIGRQAQS